MLARVHDDVIKWKHFPRYWPFVRGIHPPHKDLWRGAFDVFFDLRLNKPLSKQSRGWWFETLLRSLWRHCNKMNVSSLKQCVHHSVYQIMMTKMTRSLYIRVNGVYFVIYFLKCSILFDFIVIDPFHKSKNAPDNYPTMLHSEQKCAHFCSEWSIVGYGTGAFRDLWIRWIVRPPNRV